MKRIILDTYRLRRHRWEYVVSFLGTENVKLGRWRTMGSTNALENQIIKGMWAERRAWPEAIREFGLINVVQFSSVAQSCPTCCDPINCSMPGCPVHHQLPEPTQTHVHWVRDAIQISHPLSSPSPPAFNLS